MQDLKKPTEEMLKFLVKKMKRDGKSVKEIAEELDITQKKVKELLK